MKDEKEFIPIRKVAHANFETFVNERPVFITNAIYQYQKGVGYFSFGGAMGYYMGNNLESMVTAGLCSWSDNAVIS